MAARGDVGFRWLVRQASTDAFFMASAFAEYKAMHGISNLDLSQILRCSAKSLSRIALCRRPDDQANEFQREVQRIAMFATCDPDQLIRLLREVAAIASLRKHENETSGSL